MTYFTDSDKCRYSILKYATSILPPMPTSTKWSFRFFDKNLVCIFHLSRACYTTRPSHPYRFCHTKTQITKFLVIQISPASRHVIPLRSKYSFQHPVLKIQSTSFPSDKIPSFTPTQNG